ncbi:hypothetical protein [uncultured Litoreibacter sp.]|uniref:hypothetical protein n=1 Tax=uncultured Litoreibacter sp. TaxID=1392394 RepID=UPI002639F51C|nr:hypothetical protein [uncultured Litoreibacter sp.]
MGDFLSDPYVLQALAAGVLAAALLSGGLWLIRRNHPSLRPLKGTDPMPRDRSIAAPRAVGVSDWQSGVAGPRDKEPHILPYAGPHLLQVNADRAVIRAGGERHAARFILFVFVLAPLFVACLGLQLQQLLGFLGRGVGNCTTYVATGDGVEVVWTEVPGTLAGFLQTRLCDLALIFDSNSVHQGLGEKLSSLLDPNVLTFLGLFGLPIIALAIMARPTPAPLVFDRSRQVVYTVRKGALWAAPWDGLQMVAAGGPFTTMPAVALSRFDGDGWDPRQRWFVLAGYHARGEARAAFIREQGADWVNRWDAVRCWLVVYMTQGPQQVHGRFIGKGFADLIAPRQANLPEDSETQLDAALAAHALQTRGGSHDMPRSMKALMRRADSVVSAEQCGLTKAP